jgi:hypothetical protein
MARKPLNPRQVEVLQWIADGCPDRVWPDFTYKHTAMALQGRRLAKVSKRDGWHAEITHDGSYYLEHGVYPGEPTRAEGTAAIRRIPTQKKSGSSTVSMPPAAPEVPDEAQPGPGVPVDQPTEAAPARQAIAIPAALRNPHPAVAALRDAKGRLDMTASVRGRALRVLQALVVAAEREGFRVEVVKPQRNGYGRVWYDSKDHLVIDTGETREGVRIFQQTDRATHVLTAVEAKEAGERWGRKPPKYDYTPNEYLRIELERTWGGGQRSWSEGPRGPIDRKLPAVLEEITRRHERSKERRLQAEAERLERERQWHVVHERAKVLLQEHHRAEVLIKQADDWHRAGQLRTYVEAMREKANAMTSDEERAAASQWVEWAGAFAERLDPLSRPIGMPEEVEAKPEALKPFMLGWNPYGPRGW